jgi:hypothetical protein
MGKITSTRATVKTELLKLLDAKSRRDPEDEALAEFRAEVAADAYSVAEMSRFAVREMNDTTNTRTIVEFLESLVSNFPGFILDTEISGADLISWMDDQLGYYMPFAGRGSELALREIARRSESGDGQ